MVDRMFASRARWLVAMSVTAAIGSGCNPNPFCLNCGVQDFALARDLQPAPDLFQAGDIAEPTDGIDTDMCAPGRQEVCNGRDDDCDGVVDNVSMAVLCMDPNNCGKCGNACAYPHAYGVCGGVNNCACQMGDCQPGFYDGNKNAADGCEYSCIPTPPTKCQSAKDCSFGLQCNNGACAQTCKVDGDCPNGTICDPDTKLCEGEICDGLDNNCDGRVDEGFDLQNDGNNCGACNNVCNFPNGTAGCAAGKCSLTQCKPGFYDLDKLSADGCEYACVDANKMAIVQPGVEKCNGVDDDCDGVIDNHLVDVGGPCDDACPALAGCVAQKNCGFPLSKCAGKCCGVCTEGTTICAGGRAVCQPGLGPKLEVCNSVDDNCDGQVDEGFDLKTDALNCGQCGTVCSKGVMGGDGNAIWKCGAGSCQVASCKPGFADLDKQSANGCEYTCPVNPPTVETCNGKDDDCDGAIDNNLTQPNNFCVQTGPCAGTKPVCQGAKGFLCNYTQTNAKIEVDMNGNLAFTEMKCDGFDGNCNGQIDESFTNLGKTCFVGQGPCQGQSNFICDPNDVTKTACPASANAMKAVDEACNGVDDDCDGQIDERTPMGNPTCYNGGAHACKGWADPAIQFTGVNGKVAWIYQYEASRTDATAQAQGNGTTRSCARAGVQPWAPVTWTQANAACMAIKDSAGSAMRLCDADEWSAACSLGVAGSVWAFATNPTIYSNGMVDNSKVCNGYDEALNAPWLTGAGASCYAAQANGHVFDLTGNVAEWTSTPVMYMNTTYYKVRGGAFNNFSGGLACNFDFVINTPSYQYNDLGFRCCSDHAP